MINQSLLIDWIQNLYEQNAQSALRSVVAVSGEAEFCLELGRCWLAHLPYHRVLWISDEIEKAVPVKKAAALLGQECDVIVYDARQSFALDAFGAIAGTVVAGGMIILLLPDLRNKNSYFHKSRFYHRALQRLELFRNIFLLRQNAELPEPDKILTESKAVLFNDVPHPYRSIEQKEIVEAIVNNVNSHQDFVLVINSDRGRGKSSSLGIAAAKLLQQSDTDIIITAPRIASCEPVFYHAEKLCGVSSKSTYQLDCGNARLAFVAPDALLEIKTETELLFVDEASSIPLPMLEKMLAKFPKIVFASTVHGYEGTGRGFSLKFNKILDNHSPGWKKYQLHTPVRWLENDPVELWLDNFLVLDTELENVDELINADVDINACRIECVNRDQLLGDETRLSALFALLVYAHYRTQPSDLAYMLDNDAIRIYILHYQNKILAAALISEEGEFTPDMASAIYRGIRRPKGHLLAQTLSFHAGVEAAARLKYARVMRIAVHPQLQLRGIGSFLLNQLVEKESARGVDAIGSSFGASLELISFWKKAGFNIVRSGFSRDHVSGTHAAVVLKGITDIGREITEQLRNRYCAYIKEWLCGPLQTVDDALKSYLLEEAIDTGNDITDYEWGDIHSFAESHRGYEACMVALKKLYFKYQNKIAELEQKHQQILNIMLRDNKDWSTAVIEIGLTGKLQAVKCLKQAIQSLLKEI